MIVNRQITSRAEVEAVAREREGSTLDYKEGGDPKKWWEMAKDISAFANYVGGVLLVGAAEDDDGFPQFLGLRPEVAATLVAAYDDAALKRCRPSPVVICKRIPWDGNREMLAVNVQAYAAGLVGADFYKLNKAGEPTSSNAWQFPMRVGKDNVSLPLEQAIMQMSTQVRRVVILLSGIPSGSPMHLTFRNPNGGGAVPRNGSFKELRSEHNVALFEVETFPGLVAVPLEDIGAVWRDGEWYWSARFAGFLRQKDKATDYCSLPGCS